MEYLNRNTLPKFQERLDLASSELNSMEDIYCEAINELAGRIYNLSNLIIDPDERSKYATEPNYAIVDKIIEMQTTVANIQNDFNTLQQTVNDTITSLDNRYEELEARLNELDDAAARKEDLNTVLYRTGRN